MTTLLQRNNFTITLAESFDHDERNALSAACLITAVENAEDNAIAFRVCQQLSAFLRQIEASRVEVKAPVLQLGRDIDQVATQASAKCQAELARIDRLIAEWDAAQREEQRQVERAREREVESLRQIEEENQRKIAEAQQEMLNAQSAEAARAAAKVSADAAKSAESARAEIERIQQTPLATAEPARAPGQSLKEEWGFEPPTQGELGALFLQHGERFVKLEPKRQELKLWLNSEQCPKDKEGRPMMIGLRLSRTSKQTIRGNNQKALNV